MQKAPVMRGSDLKPLDDGNKASDGEQEVHVFGRNLEDRVITNDEEDSPSISFSNPNINENRQNLDEDDIDSIRKRKFDAITGEEDEETIFQGDFKLYVWDLATSNWIEKGRGQLKLNDTTNEDEKKSRLIMRVGGTLRIILNVAINRSFFKVIANTKTNIRFTDSQCVWAASGTNAHQLRDLIDERLKASAENEEASARNEKASAKNEESSTKNEEASTKREEDSTKNEEPSTKNEEASTKREEDSTKNEEASTKKEEDSTKIEEPSSKNEKVSAENEEDEEEDDDEGKQKRKRNKTDVTDVKSTNNKLSPSTSK